MLSSRAQPANSSSLRASGLTRGHDAKLDRRPQVGLRSDSPSGRLCAASLSKRARRHAFTSSCLLAPIRMGCREFRRATARRMPLSGMPRRWSSLGARPASAVHSLRLGAAAVRSRSQGASPRRRGTPGGEPHLLRVGKRGFTDRFRCSARKVARGGLNAEGDIVGGETCELGFRVAVRSASRSP